MAKNQSPPEAWEQEQLFAWLRANQAKHTVFQLVNASMNGVRVSPRLRLAMKRQGLRAGVPDIDVPVARGGYHGLRIELKRQHGGQVSREQKAFHALLLAEGYRVEVCKGWREAQSVILDYLAIG